LNHHVRNLSSTTWRLLLLVVLLVLNQYLVGLAPFSALQKSNPKRPPKNCEGGFNSSLTSESWSLSIAEEVLKKLEHDPEVSSSVETLS
jgi:hypothetical protein